jgi:hypothetical protein
MIAKARTTTTVSHLKQLQVANSCYAADNDGWYVTNFEGGWNHPWKANRSFLEYLGWKGTDPWAEASKVTRSGFPEPMSVIAYNIVKAPRPGGGSAHYWENHAMRLRQNHVAQPTSMIAFADANDWWMAPEAWNNWQSRERNDKDHSAGGAMTAYRNAGKAAAITFAGNVVMLDRSEMNPATPEGARRWYYNGRKWN